MLRPVLVTPPASLSLVSLAEAKEWCRVEHGVEDALITTLVKAAESFLDGKGIMGRALAPQTWSQQYSAFSDRMDMPIGDVQSITSITYFDGTNAVQTLSASVYQLMRDEIGYYASLKSGQVWPSPYTRDDAVKITWVAGYADAASVPAAIKVAMRMLICQAYADRKGEEPVSQATTSLAWPFMQMGV